MLDRFDKALADAEKRVKSKGLLGVPGKLQNKFWGLFNEEETEVYKSVILNAQTYDNNEQLQKLLENSFQLLNKDQIVSNDLFDPRAREILPTEGSSKSPKTNQLMATLSTWVKDKK